jgi:hypothetical protein
MLQPFTKKVPFVGGQNTKIDPRALEAPFLEVCENLEFDRFGGLNKRPKYSALSLAILGGGTLSNIRKLVSYGDELLCFTKDALYSYAEESAVWVSKGTYLAPKVTERAAFIRSTDQVLCDRAELDGVVVVAWLDKSASNVVYVGAYDKETGAVLLAPTSMGANTDRPRLVALTDKILLFCQTAATTLGAKAIDPASLASSAGAAFTDVAALTLKSPTTSHGVASVTEALAVTSINKVRSCSSSIAVAVSADGTRVAVIRSNGTNIQGDILNSSLADLSTGAAVGTAASSAVHAISAGFRSVADSGEFRCYSFWTADPLGGTPTSPGFETKSNWLNTAGAVGTQGSFLIDCCAASKAFDHEGRVYLWLSFAGTSQAGGFLGQLDNAYFLYRDDGLLIAKGASNVGGGHPASVGHLPGVQNTASNVFVFCGTERRSISLGSRQSTYGDSGPREIEVEFDSNAARRTALLGATLYITGGQVMQYDGEGLAELAFHIAPYGMSVVDSGVAGGLEAGTYVYKATWGWPNAKGELDRSSTGTYFDQGISAGRKANVDLEPLHVTHKQGTRSAPAVEIWRTVRNAGTTGAPFYLTTRKDPSVVTGDNRYIPNEPTTLGYITTVFVDSYADSQLRVKESNPENEGRLPSTAPPAATIILAGYSRIFLAGIADDPYSFWYSLERGDGEVAGFHSGNRVTLSAEGGAITGLGFLNGALVVFQERRVSLLTGSGFDNNGLGENYGPPQILHADLGATSADLIASHPQGLVFFSQKGWKLLDRGLSIQHLGLPIEEFNSDAFAAVHVMEDQHQIRCLSAERMLAFDYLVTQWSQWTEPGATACVWRGLHYIASATEILYEDPDAAQDFSWRFKTAPIRLSDLQQGYQRIWKLALLGEWRSSHTLQFKVYRDYRSEPFMTKSYTPAPGEPGDPLQVRVSPTSGNGLSQVIQLEATDLNPSGESARLTGLEVFGGTMAGPRRLPAGQKI